jgi:hypothetical protein
MDPMASAVFARLAARGADEERQEHSARNQPM